MSERMGPSPEEMGLDPKEMEIEKSPEQDAGAESTEALPKAAMSESEESSSVAEELNQEMVRLAEAAGVAYPSEAWDNRFHTAEVLLNELRSQARQKSRKTDASGRPDIAASEQAYAATLANEVASAWNAPHGEWRTAGDLLKLVFSADPRYEQLISEAERLSVQSEATTEGAEGQPEERDMTQAAMDAEKHMVATVKQELDEKYGEWSKWHGDMLLEKMTEHWNDPVEGNAEMTMGELLQKYNPDSGYVKLAVSRVELANKRADEAEKAEKSLLRRWLRLSLA